MNSLYAPITISVNPMFQSLFDHEVVSSRASEEQARTSDAPSDRVRSDAVHAQPDANLPSGHLSSTRKHPPKAALKYEEPVSAVDRQLLVALVLLRFLSYAQIQRRFFPDSSIQAVGQRVKRLTMEGWVTTWDQPVRFGGKPRFVLPTKRALRWALGKITFDAYGSPLQRLVAFMSPQRPRRPLELDSGLVPPFFHHQRECNDLIVALETRGPTTVLWASTWDRPFPNSDDGLPMPQPDGVLVLGSTDDPRLVFLEHDRGMESLAHFRSAKVERYGELSVRPDLCEELLGFREFTVWVSVLDKRFRRPRERLEALSRLAVLGGTEQLMSFTLAGWLRDSPAELCGTLRLGLRA